MLPPCLTCSACVAGQAYGAPPQPQPAQQPAYGGSYSGQYYGQPASSNGNASSYAAGVPCTSLLATHTHAQRSCRLVWRAVLRPAGQHKLAMAAAMQQVCPAGSNTADLGVGLTSGLQQDNTSSLRGLVWGAVHSQPASINWQCQQLCSRCALLAQTWQTVAAMQLECGAHSWLAAR